MSVKTKTKLLNICSTNSNSLNGSYKSLIEMSIPDLNFNYENVESVYFSVLHAEVPYSFYNINYTNDNININNVVYTITHGNYNANTLITAILTVIPSTYSITYNSITCKYSFTNTTIDFIIYASSTMNNVLGLGTSNLSSTNKIATMSNVVNFIVCPRLNFKSSFFKFNNYDTVNNECDTFFCLQNNASPNGMINYINQTSSKLLVENKYISPSFTIGVFDTNDNYINFNNIDWYMTMQIDIIYLDVLNNETFNSIIKNKNSINNINENVESNYMVDLINHDNEIYANNIDFLDEENNN